MHVGNLFTAAEAPATGERFAILQRIGGVEIERIVSSDAPDATLYDQAWPEWVLLLRGRAELEIEGERVVLGAGDYLHLPAHTPHRVCATAAGSLWLAVHGRGAAAGSD